MEMIRVIMSTSADGHSKNCNSNRESTMKNINNPQSHCYYIQYYTLYESYNQETNIVSIMIHHLVMLVHAPIAGLHDLIIKCNPCAMCRSNVSYGF